MKSLLQKLLIDKKSPHLVDKHLQELNFLHTKMNGFIHEDYNLISNVQLNQNTQLVMLGNHA